MSGLNIDTLALGPTDEEIDMQAAHAYLKTLDTNVPEAVKTNLATLRLATQVRELVLQGITIKNTLVAMNEVWLQLYTEDKRCLIVDQVGTKVKYQLVNLYAMKLIRYMNSIVGMDLVPLAQQNPETRTWKMDAVLLNISGNRTAGHEHLFVELLINLFGLSEQVVQFSLTPTWEGLRQYVLTTYDIDLGDTENAKGEPELELIDGAIYNLLAGKAFIPY